MPKDNGVKKKKTKSKLRHRVKITVQLIVLLTLLAILAAILYFYLAYGKTILRMQSEAKQMVEASTEDTFKASQTSLVYDTDGNLISTLKSEKDVYYLKYEDIPTAAIDALVVTEDRKFFEHGGVDYWANVRAAIELIKHKGHITQGASTITQQLARSVFLTQEVTYTRKIKEIFVAQELEKKYSKNKIMEFYLNSIYFANGHYGIQAAAQAYFGEGVNALSLSQIAFLCAIPNSPNRYNPLTNYDNTLERRDRILKQMYENDKIDETEYENALNETITLVQSSKSKTDYVETYVYYCAIRALMEQQGFEIQYEFDSEEDQKAYDEEYDDLYYSIQKDLYIHGYRIYTSIDMDKQELLQQAVDEELKAFTDMDENGVYKMQGAAVCIDNDTGRVVAIVGGRQQDLGSFTLNRAYQSYRQPGSSIKPLIVYTPSFEQSYTPESIVNDVYTKDGPKNSDGKYLGKIKLQKALEKSINTIAWQLFKELTPKVGLSYLLNMNFSKISESDYTLAAALGGLTNGVSPIEMASGYATLENDGYYREPTCIVKIMDSEGNEVAGSETQEKEIYDTRAARIMTEALTGVIKNGTAKGLGLKNTISAGKTGTTNDKRDGWFVGYTPYYTTSVWVGYDIPKTVSDLMGSSYPGRIWHAFMDEIHTKSMTRTFEYYDWRAEIEEEQITVTPTQAPTPTQVTEEEGLPEDNTETTPEGGQDTTGEEGTGENQADNPDDTTGGEVSVTATPTPEDTFPEDTVDEPAIDGEDTVQENDLP